MLRMNKIKIFELGSIFPVLENGESHIRYIGKRQVLTSRYFGNQRLTTHRYFRNRRRRVAERIKKTVCIRAMLASFSQPFFLGGGATPQCPKHLGVVLEIQ
jgi:hypothetical protein